MSDNRHMLERIWWAGVNAVRGDTAVTRTLEQGQVSRPDAIIAVGKAACAMAQAAYDHFGPDVPGLVVTKYGHATPLPPAARVIEAAHPVPDENALVAGLALRDLVADMAAGSHLLMLVSGGASALAELPAFDLTLQALQAENTRLLAEGLDIHAMNARRRQLSQIKGGKLLAGFRGALVTTLAISDVQGDVLAVIGSGIGDVPEDHGFSFDPFIAASNSVARAACEAEAEALGLSLQTSEETLYDDVYTLADRIGARMRDAAPGLYLFGGEPTIVLPPDPGQGGRNQALALALGREIWGRDDLHILVAGTDGTDGPTDAAGGYVNGATWDETAARFLRGADSGYFLETRGGLFKSGPTGTNVMDLALVLKTGAAG